MLLGNTPFDHQSLLEAQWLQWDSKCTCINLFVRVHVPSLSLSFSVEALQLALAAAGRRRARELVSHRWELQEGAQLEEHERKLVESVKDLLH